MSYAEFRGLVGRMMAKQQEYFRTRSSAHLAEAKELEGQVRGELKRALPQEGPAQGDLFGGGQGGPYGAGA